MENNVLLYSTSNLAEISRIIEILNSNDISYVRKNTFSNILALQNVNNSSEIYVDSAIYPRASELIEEDPPAYNGTSSKAGVLKNGASLGDIQNFVQNFCKDNKMEATPSIRLFDMMSELGEVAKEFVSSSDYGKKSFEVSNNLQTEIGDVLYSLITLANSLNINLDTSLNAALIKYSHRLETSGSAANR